MRYVVCILCIYVMYVHISIHVHIYIYIRNLAKQTQPLTEKSEIYFVINSALFYMLFAIRPAEGKVNIFLFASTHNSIWIIKAEA